MRGCIRIRRMSIRRSIVMSLRGSIRIRMSIR